MKRLVAGIVVAGVLTVASSLPASLTHASTYVASQQAAPAAAPSPADIVATAKQYLGSSYATIGNSPSTGFSCIGFVNFVFHQNGVNVPFDIPMAWNSAPHVAMSELMPGDVVFFSNTVFAGLSHVAIYIGDNQMIGADSFAVGVTTDRLSDTYWMEHYTGATRPLALVGGAPMPGTGNDSQGAEPTATPVPPAPVVASAPSGTLLQPLSTTVGMYSGPGYEYTAVTTLGPSSILTVVQAQGGWYNVRFGDTYGWVNASDVGPVGGNQAPAQAQAQSQSVPVATATTEPTRSYSKASATSNAVAGSTLYVAQGPLKIRSGPGKGFKEIGYLLVGTRLTVREVQPGWAHVVTPTGMLGWVAMEYLSQAMPAHYSKASISQGTNAGTTRALSGRVTASVLNVRAQPDSHARVITVLFAGEMVQVLARRTGWDQVRLRNGSIGWVSAAYLAIR